MVGPVGGGRSLGRAGGGPASTDVIHQPYQLDTGLVSRSISFENPTGAQGEGGKAASQLGPGRKGAASRNVRPGETVQLCDIEGPGTIRHIWITISHGSDEPRSTVLTAWWDGQEHPSIQCPVGDFFGAAHAKIKPYCSAVHSFGNRAGMNIWLPMPFQKRARFAFTNEGSKPVPLYYQITYTLGDKHPADVGRLHVLFRRENPTTLKSDFELLPERRQKGRYIGAVIGIRNLHPDQWWGEGEFKVYMDGDKEYPTICGTGSEDYVGLSWGMQQTPFLYNGCSLDEKGFRLDVPLAPGRPDRLAEAVPDHDPADCQRGRQICETQDNWSCATFWYEPVPSAPVAAHARRQGPHRRSRDPRGGAEIAAALRPLLLAFWLEIENESGVHGEGFRPRRSAAKDLRNRQLKTRQQFFADERIRCGEEHRLRPAGIAGRRFRFRIDDPYGNAAGLEPILGLGDHFAAPPRSDGEIASTARSERLKKSPPGRGMRSARTKATSGLRQAVSGSCEFQKARFHRHGTEFPRPDKFSKCRVDFADDTPMIEPRR